MKRASSPSAAGGGVLADIMDFWPHGGSAAGVTSWHQRVGYLGAMNTGGSASGNADKVWGNFGVAQRNGHSGGSGFTHYRAYALPFQSDPNVFPVYGRVPLRYLFEATIWRTGATNLRTSFGFTNQGQGFVAGPNTVGFEIIADSTLNGGNLTMRRRTTLGGGISSYTPSNVDGTIAANPKRYEFEYIDGPTRTFTVRCDGVALWTVSNPSEFVNYGAFPAVVTGENYAFFYGAAEVANVSLFFSRLRYRIFLNG